MIRIQELDINPLRFYWSVLTFLPSSATMSVLRLSHVLLSSQFSILRIKCHLEGQIDLKQVLQVGM